MFRFPNFSALCRLFNPRTNRRRPPQRNRLQLEPLEDRQLLAVSLVMDINPGAASSDPGNGFQLPLAIMGGNAYFAATTQANGRELWRSDGTGVGTLRVADINNGAASSNPEHITAVGGTLFFSADDGVNGRQLWKSDGNPNNANGTVRVLTNAGIGVSSPGFQSNFAVMGGTVFFAGNDGTNGFELWKSDGTANGTVMVKDINTANVVGGAAGNSFPQHLTVVGNTLFFSAISEFPANSGTYGRYLWKSDGTENGTDLVRDVNNAPVPDPGGFGGQGGLAPLKPFAVMGGAIYFSGRDANNDWELWTADANNGAARVADINNMGSSDPREITTVGNQLYFSAIGSVAAGRELWISNGTPAGTSQVADIYSGNNNSSNPGDFTAVPGGTVFFRATTAAGTKLWKTDGNPNNQNGTVMVNPPPGVQPFSSPGGLTAVGATVYFHATRAQDGDELWKTNGTAAGTVLVKDINVGITSSTPRAIAFDGVRTLYFAATRVNDPDENVPNVGRELFKEEVPAGQVRGNAWDDGNGAAGLASVTVQLLDADQNVLQTTSTDATGDYSFDKLDPGTYYVRFVAPSYYGIVAKSQSDDGTLPNAADPTTGLTAALQVGYGTDALDVDAGLRHWPQASGLVWVDANANGTREDGEAALAGVTVQLLDANKNLLASTTTDANGSYVFLNLDPGAAYYVRFVAPENYTFSLQDQGQDDTVDSDADPNSGRTDVLDIALGTDALYVDAGLVYHPKNG
jgi:ELWxxDGT repeat protein